MKQMQGELELEVAEDPMAGLWEPREVIMGELVRNIIRVVAADIRHQVMAAMAWEEDLVRWVLSGGLLELGEGPVEMDVLHREQQAAVAAVVGMSAAVAQVEVM